MRDDLPLPLKYRPEVFEELVGQDSNVRFLSSLIRKGRKSNIVLQGSFGSGKCVGRDTLIFTDKGLIPIYRLSSNRDEDKFSSLGVNVCNVDCQEEEAQEFYYNGMKPSFTVVTAKGYKLCATGNHPVYVLDLKTGSLGFVRVEELDERFHWIVLQCPEMFPNKRVTNKERILAKVAGYFLSSKEDREVEDEVFIEIDARRYPDLPDLFFNDLKKSFGKKVYIEKMDPDRWSHRVRIGIKDSEDVVDDYVLDKPILYREVPDTILCGGKEVQRAFLSGYFEGCGIFDSGRRDVRIQMESEKLADQIHVMLLNFGILAVRRKTEQVVVDDMHEGGGIRDVYTITITSDRYKIQFNREIGFLSKHKGDVLRARVEREGILFNRRFAKGIPEVWGVVNRIIASEYNNSSELRKIFNTKSRVTYDQIEDYLKVCERDNLTISDVLLGYMDTKDKRFYFDTISSINLGDPCEMMDLSVEGSHTFNSAGFVSHNTSSGRIYSRALNCLSVSESGSPCNECINCRSFYQGTYPDYHELDASSSGRVEQVRELVELAKTPPLQGRYRIILMDEAQSLSRQGFDALLKLIEEPPEHLVFIFCTTEVEKVRPAILSRCQVLRVNTLDRETSKKHLEKICELEGIRAEDKALDLITYISKGHPRDLLKNLEQCSVFGDITVDAVIALLSLDYVSDLCSFVKGLVGNDLGRVREVIQGWSNTPSEIAVILEEFILHVLYKEIRRASIVVNPVFESIPFELIQVFLRWVDENKGVEVSVEQALLNLLNFIHGVNPVTRISLDILLVNLFDLVNEKGFSISRVMDVSIRENQKVQSKGVEPLVHQTQRRLSGNFKFSRDYSVNLSSGGVVEVKKENVVERVVNEKSVNSVPKSEGKMYNHRLIMEYGFRKEKKENITFL